MDQNLNVKPEILKQLEENLCNELHAIDVG